MSVREEEIDEGTYCMNAVAMITPEPKNFANLFYNKERISIELQVNHDCYAYSNTAVGTHFDLRNTIGRSVPTSDVT